jgi:hypothetical protein
LLQVCEKSKGLKPGFLNFIGLQGFETEPGGFKLRGQLDVAAHTTSPAHSWSAGKFCAGSRGVAAQVDPFESKGLKPVFHFPGSKGLEPNQALASAMDQLDSSTCTV